MNWRPVRTAFRTLPMPAAPVWGPLAPAAVGLVPIAVVALSLVASLTAVAQEKHGDVKVKWFGQACFELDFPTGCVVLVDPFGPIGYRFPKDVKPDVVTISHEHPDHNNDK